MIIAKWDLQVSARMLWEGTCLGKQWARMICTVHIYVVDSQSQCHMLGEAETVRNSNNFRRRVSAEYVRIFHKSQNKLLPYLLCIRRGRV